MNTLPTKILLATDGSEDAILAARAAVNIARGGGSELHVVYAQEPLPHYVYPGMSPGFYSQVQDLEEREARNLLDKQVKFVEDSGGRVAEVYLRHGPISDEILYTAEDIKADLIVIGSRGLGPVKRLVLGSVSESVVHRTPCPVLVMRGGPEAWPPQRIVIGEDGSEAAERAGELAASIGKLSRARGLILQVYPRLLEVDIEGREVAARMIDDELRREERSLEERATRIEEHLGSRPKIRIAVGDPAANILEAAEESDAPEKVLTAVGSRGLGTVRRMMLGSVSTKVLRAARGPVLVYPGSTR